MPTPTPRTLTLTAHSWWLAPLLLAACGGGGDGGTSPVEPPPPAVTGIALSTATIELRGVGAEAAVDATLQPAGVSGTVTWQVEQPSVATIAASGTRATVRAVAGGTTRLVARVGSREASATITVTPIARAIALPGDTVRLVVGATQVLTPAITADDGADTARGWSSGTPSVAGVSAAGVVSALTPGVSLVTVTLTAFPALSASRPVRVSLPTVAVTVAPSSATVLTGGTHQLTATVAADSGVSRDVTWSTSAGAVATVSTTGVVTAVTPGTATVTATSVANPSASGSATITVASPTVRTITLAPVTTSVFLGGERPLQATIDADPGADTTVLWTSSAPAIVGISATGVATGLAIGTATITARSQLVPSVQATAQVTVLDPPGATQFSTRFLGAGQSLGGWGGLAVHSFGAAGALLGVGIQGGGGGSFLNALLLRTVAGTQDITPACCSRAGLPTVLAGMSPSQALVAFSGDLVFGGGGPAVLRVQGAATTPLPWPPAGQSSFTRADQLYTPDGATVIARVSDGTVFRLDGALWTNLGSIGSTGVSTDEGTFLAPLDFAYVRCEGASATPVFRRWQGGTDVTEQPPVPGMCSANLDTRIAGVRHDSMVAVNPSGMHLWNGTTWRTVTAGLPASDTLVTVTMCGTERFAGTRGGAVYRLTGSTLSRIGEPSVTGAVADFGGRVTRVHCAPDLTLRASAGSSLLTRWTGTSWVEENFAPDVRGVSLASDGTGAAVGDGVVYRWNGTSWSLLRRFTDRGLRLASVIARPGGELLATGPGAGTNGPAVVLRYTGSWSEITLPGYQAFTRMVPLGATSALLIAEKTFSAIELYRLDGTTLAPVAYTLGGTPTVLAGHPGGTALLMTNFGVVSQYDGATWSPAGTLPFSPGTNWPLAMLSPTEAMAGSCTGSAGNPSRIYRRVAATSWAETPISGTPTITCIRSIFGTSPSDSYALVLFADGSGGVLRWNGSSWSLLATPDVGLARAGAAIPGLTMLTGFRAFNAEGRPPAALRVRRQ